MFWKVAGFSQPSPIEQILDKEEFTLEELLNEEDLIQECKSLNGRLVAFLRERSTVEQLIRYMVEPALDTDDPKRTYKYPFTACEVFCCEVEAVFNTLLEDAELLALLFSLLDSEPPLSAKTAGYFGRLVGHLLLRKTSELMQYLQEHPVIIEKLVRHVDTTSISDILKRIVGADEQSSMLFLPTYTLWLADTPLIDLLLQRLGAGYSSDVQANAADILSAIAHTQPTPLAARLMREEAINTLFSHALRAAESVRGASSSGGGSEGGAAGSDASTANAIAAGGACVLVPALDVAIALIEPRRSQELTSGGGMLGNSGDDTSVASSGGAMSPSADAARRTRIDAVSAIVRHLPALVALLESSGGAANQETPYGLLTPSLGRSRLKVVELVAVMLRSGEAVAEIALIGSGAIPVCLSLFERYPFNNLLHHHVTALLLAAITRPPLPSGQQQPQGASPAASMSGNSALPSASGKSGVGQTPEMPSIIAYLFEQCKLLDWVVGLPSEVRPTPRPGQEAIAAAKAPLRAGYLGHVTHIAATLESIAAGPAGGSEGGRGSDEEEDLDLPGRGGPGGDADNGVLAAIRVPIMAYLSAHSGWQEWYASVLAPRQVLENTARWECGRPAATDLGGMDSDGDEYQNYFIKDLTSSDAPMSGSELAELQPALYHRYNVADEADEDDDDDDDDDSDDGGGGGGHSSGLFRAGGAGSSYGAQLMAEALSAMHLNEEDGEGDAFMRGSGDFDGDHVSGNSGSSGGSSTDDGAGGSSAAGGPSNMDDDEVLLATSDEDQEDVASTAAAAAAAATAALSSPASRSSGSAGAADSSESEAALMGSPVVMQQHSPVSQGSGGSPGGREQQQQQQDGEAGSGSVAIQGPAGDQQGVWKPTWPAEADGRDSSAAS